MTNEEAITKLQEISEDFILCKDNCFDMAIAALQRENMFKKMLEEAYLHGREDTINEAISKAKYIEYLGTMYLGRFISVKELEQMKE